MTAEKLSDALSFLDDDIIEETNALRVKKRNYKSIWIKALSAAACMCIALVAVMGVLQIDIPYRGKGNTVPTNSEEYKYGGWDGTCYGTTVGESFWYYVKVTEWGSEELYGVVIGSECEGGELPVGEEVKIEFYEDVWIIKNIEESDQGYFHKIPDEDDFPVGSIIKVEVHGINVTDGYYSLRTGFLGDIAPWETVPDM